MENLPLYVYAAFGIALIIAIAIFYAAARYSKIFLTVIVAVTVTQSFLGFSGFYNLANTIPPRFPLLILPSVIILVALFFTKRGKIFIDSLNIRALTILHTVRILIELVLYWLFLYKAVPELMTFSGRNFDMFAGLSAPLIYYFGFIIKQLNSAILIAWNFVSLALLGNIVFYAVLSVPTKFQLFAFDQPNIALGYFPFLLLPAVIVPLVLLAHVASIKQLLNNNISIKHIKK